MRATRSLSCLFLLSLGSACFPAGGRQEPGDPAPGTRPERSWREAAAAAERGGPGGWRGSRGESGALRATPRLRCGSREGSRLRPAGGEGRSGALGHLAEELHGYDRKKGGFAFRFGR
ncbi:orexigenic neuropeptide QRFP [Rhea pennata]|uniref:orexigenic neuropeptide QRFP n=1 Tax=Rhea pennata TaxID=8795 RepID=UPI002E273E89